MKTLLLCVLLAASATAFAQAPGIEWQKTYGGGNSEFAYAITATADGGFITAGISNTVNGDVTGNHGLNDLWVVKLNSLGTIQWQKSLGGSANEYALSIQQTSDGGYIIAGFSFSNDGDVSGHHGSVNYSDYWVVKLTADGDIQWQKSLGGTSNELATSVKQTGDGGYIVVGYSKSTDGDITSHHGTAGSADWWVVKLNSTGNIQWQKSLGGPSEDVAHSVQVTPDGGYIVAGESGTAAGDVTINHGAQDYWVVKLSSTGNIQWQKSLGGFGQDIAYAVQVAPDGGYIVAGSAQSVDGDATGNHGGLDYWVVKLSSTGSLQWQKSLGGSKHDNAMSILPVPGGNYIIAGTTASTDGDVTGNHGKLDYWVVKINNTGNILWQKSLGGSNDDAGFGIVLAPGGGYTIAGYTFSNDGDVSGLHGNGDEWVVKLATDAGVTIKANTGTNICVNTKVTFTASVLAGVQSPAYQWKKNNTNVGTNSATYADSVLKTGDSVYCIVTSTGSIDTSNGIRFTMYTNYQPTIKITGNNSLCDGEKTTYKAVVTNTAPAYNLQWKKNGVNVGSDSLEYTPASLQNSDSVWCVVTSITGCTVSPAVASNKIKLKVTANVLPAVTVAATPAVYRFCSASPSVALTFHASIKNGGGTPFYQWKKNGINSGANSSTYTDSLQNGDSIWCVFTSSAKCITTNNVVSNKLKITITAPVTPTVTVVPLPAGAICLGTPVRFKASIKNGGSAPRYQWKKNNTNVGTDSDTYNDNALFNNDSVWCVFTSNTECAVNNPAISAKIKQAVTYNPPLKPSAVSGPASVTANQHTLGYSVNQVNDVIYVWAVPAGCTIVTGQGTNQIIVNWGSTSGSIIVRAKNACGQSDSSKLLVRVASSFSSGAANDNNGSEDALKAAGKEGIQLYPNPAVNTAYISFTSPEAGKYFIQVTDAQGRVLQTKETNAVKGANKLTVDVSHYAQGLYFIRLAGSNKQQSLRLLIQR